MLDITALPATNTGPEIGHAATAVAPPIRRRRHASRWAAPAAISALALFAGVSTAIDGALVGPLLRQGMKHVFDQPVGGSVALSAAISVFAGGAPCAPGASVAPHPHSTSCAGPTTSPCGMTMQRRPRAPRRQEASVFRLWPGLHHVWLPGRSMVALFDPVVRAISGRRWF